MNINVKIFRYNPEKSRESDQLVDYVVRAEPGMSVLALLHQVHEEQDGTLAYRYSCRGAICGTCAIKVNGISRLACKTQVSDLLKEHETIILEPLDSFAIIKDLVVDKRPYWDAIRKTIPWLVRDVDIPDEKMNYESKLEKMPLDQLNRAADCIKCASCYAACPKVKEMPEFIGPATSIQVFRQLYDPRDTKTNERLNLSAAKGGVFDCDKHANCVKVCPKDCRPLRAITMIQNRVNAEKR